MKGLANSYFSAITMPWKLEKRERLHRTMQPAHMLLVAKAMCSGSTFQDYMSSMLAHRP